VDKKGKELGNRKASRSVVAGGGGFFCVGNERQRASWECRIVNILYCWSYCYLVNIRWRNHVQFKVDCSMCGHSLMIGPLETGGQGGVKLHAKLETFRTASFVAYICEKCGFVALFVDDMGFKNLHQYFINTRRQ
jgi:hypothetical protein